MKLISQEYRHIMDIFDKKITRKQFIWSGLSFFGLLFFGSFAKRIPAKPKAVAVNAYGNHAYGGSKSA
ncbi:MAG: hypothetical protein V4478_04200 [Patescibacteria group bacterium]